MHSVERGRARRIVFGDRAQFPLGILGNLLILDPEAQLLLSEILENWKDGQYPWNGQSRRAELSSVILRCGGLPRCKVYSE